MVGTGTTQEILAIYQPKELLISLERSLGPENYGVLKKHPHGRQKN